MILISYWSIQEFGMPDGAPCMIMGALQDEVKKWWDSAMASTFAGWQPHDGTWEELMAEFDGKCFPPNVRKKNERGLQTHRWGFMIVVEYEARFWTLERFTPDIDIVSTKYQRVKHFYKVLHYEIQMALIGRTFVTFGDVVRGASEAKQVLATWPRWECKTHDSS